MDKISIVKNVIIYILMAMSFASLFLYLNVTIIDFLLLLSVLLVTIIVSYFLVTVPKRMWYKRLVIDKFDGKELSLSFDAYDSELKKHVIRTEAKNIDFYITDAQEPIFEATINNKINFFFKAELVGQSIALCDRFGNTYKYNDIQISKNTDKIRFLHQDIEEFRKRISDFYDVKKSDKWTIDPDSFKIKIK